MPDKLLSSKEWLDRLVKYIDSLPNHLVWGELIALLFDLPVPREANYDIEDFYGDPDKAPLWLQCVANAQPGHYESAFAEARVHLAAELAQSQEVSNDEPIVTVTPI
jgi:hypothetical protein